MGYWGVHICPWVTVWGELNTQRVVHWSVWVFHKHLALRGWRQLLYLAYEEVLLIHELLVLCSVCQEVRQKPEQAFSILRQDPLYGV